MSEHDFPKKPAEQSNRCDNPMGRQDGTEGAAPSKSGREGVKAELERRQGWAEYGAARNRGENPTHPGVASVLAQRAVAIRAAAERVMRKPGDSKQSAATQIPKSGGSPLAPNVKTQMEQQLGADLSEVKIHTGTDSARAAEQLGARAMTVGSDVHFAAGQFAPETKEGTRLLTHELTHVVQGQKSGVQRKAEPGDGERKVEARGTPGAAPAEGGDAKGEAHSDDSGKATGEHTEVSQPGEPAEQEADKIADDVTKKLHGGDEKRRGNKADENGEKADAKEKGGGKRVGSSGGAASPEGEGSSVGAANEGEGGEAEAQGPEAPKSQAGPNGVKARAEAAHAEGMSAGHAAAEKKPAQIRAQLEGVGLKVWRTATTRPPTPAPIPPADPAAAWRDYVNGLPAELKGPASTIVDPDEQNAFKPLLPSEKSSFCQLTGKDIRLEFAGLPGRARANVAVLLIEPDSKRIYETLPSALRATWRDLTPDERIDLLKGGDAQVQRLLPDPAALNRWRQNRNLDVLKTQPRLAAELAVPGGETPEKIIEGLSVGDAGERLRRIMADTSFAVEATKSQFILETWNLVKGGKSPIDAMWQLQSKYALKGKEAKNDPKWDDIPLLKAIPTKWIGNYGKLDLSDLVACLNTAPKTDTEVPRKPDGSVDAAQARIKNEDAGFRQNVVGKYYPAYAKAAGVDAARIAYTIQGRGTPAAYWMAAADGMSIVTKKEAEVSKILAVDENPDYATGFIITRLDETTKKEWVQSQGNITRPTAIDALGFNQFAINPDSNECLGVTSGGMKEAVIRAVPLNRTTVVRQP